MLLPIVNRSMSLRYDSLLKKAGLLLLVAAAMSLAGCITFLSEIKVNGDGSGTMVQTITMNPEQLKATMDSIAKQMGATTTEAKEEPKKESPKPKAEGPFKEDELKSKAADLGQGVTFVSAEKIDTKTAAGVRVTYAFKDINTLAINPKPQAAMGTAAAGAASKDAMKFRFSRKPDGHAVLTVVLARPEPEAAKEKASPPPPAASSEEEAQQREMVRQMFKGLHMGVTVEVEGKIIRTNSPYVDGSKVTLLDIDFDPLLSDQGKLEALNKKMEGAMGDDEKTLEALKGIKGLKITTSPEVTIEFAPK
jgi:outer membrane murein-binding lipoprotein Lpp